MRSYAMFFVLAAAAAAAAAKEVNKKELELQAALAQALQEPRALTEVLADLQKSHENFKNTTLTLLTKYIIKREVDKYRPKEGEAIKRRVFSAYVMKLLDISKDLPREMPARRRVERAVLQYRSAGTQSKHDGMADRQLFHVFVRLYDIMTATRRILWKVQKSGKVTATALGSTLERLGAKPVHLGIGLLVQYNLRRVTNYALRHNILDDLSSDSVRVPDTLLELATLLLPVAELVDLHLAHSSPLFRSTCPDSWLGVLTPHVSTNLECDGDC